MTREPVAVYVHTPFCPSKCGYCDFNSYAMTGPIIERTVDAIRKEVLSSPWRGKPAKSIFFGGGTPTFLTASQLCSLLDAVASVHPPIEQCEITSEANPGTVDASKFVAMRGAGFNRVSLGAQSFVDADLLTLERVHQACDIERAVGSARDARFANVNLDLMFALPKQSRYGWKRNLDKAISLSPEHLSLYCLTIEENTKFFKEFLHGRLSQPSDEEQVEMYQDTLDVTRGHGYLQYEISNFSKPGFECRHNLCYWKLEDYAGYGPGAVGCMDGANIKGAAVEGNVRYTNLKHPERYAAAVESGTEVAFEWEELSSDARRTERIMMGLRLDEGLRRDAIDLSPDGLSTVLSRGWVIEAEGSIRLTRLGKNYCSEVAVELL